MVDALHSVLGLVKDLLPVSTGGPLPLTPRIPDVPAFLDRLVSLLESPDSESTSDRTSAELRRREQEKAREALRKDLEERLRQLPQDGSAVQANQQIRILLERLNATPAMRTAAPPPPPAGEHEEVPVEAAVDPAPEAPSQPFAGSVPAPPTALPDARVAPTLPPPPGMPADPVAAPAAAMDGGEDGPVPASPPVADKADYIDRMVQGARVALARGAARMRLVLRPPHLGDLRVDLSVRDRVIQAEVRAETPAAKELILANLASLREALESQGLRMGEFRVNVDPSFRQAPGDTHGSASTAVSGSAASSEGAVPRPTVRSVGPHLLDVRA